MHTLGNFLQLEKFHDGSSNQLYRARRVADETPVVIKMPRSEYPTNRELARLHNEYQLLTELHTPGIVKVYGLEKFGRSVALIMQSIDGESLQTLLSQRQLTITECLTLAIKIASLLAEVHAQQIVHRDIKPSNTTIDRDPSVIVPRRSELSTKHGLRRGMVSRMR